MPNYFKRGLWLRGVARRLEDETLATLLEAYADKMIGRANNDASFNRTRAIKAGTH